MVTKRTTATDYGDELLDYGGVPTPRREIIADLEAQGASARAIALYLFGLDRHAKTEQEA